jgi:hypothetical protein
MYRASNCPHYRFLQKEANSFEMAPNKMQLPFALKADRMR